MQRPPSSLPTALITGATTGIGYKLSKLFAKDQYNLILVARNESLLEERKSELETQFDIKVNAIPKDLSNPETVEEILTLLNKAKIHVDVLVNNAGVGAIGRVEEIDLQRQLDMIQLNVTSLTALTRLVLEQMRQRGEGKILNVSSTAAFQPGPSMAVYYATKAYVLSFSEALANELRGTGITVSTLCPGPTKTEFQRRAGFENVLLMKSRVMSAERVARIGYRGLQKGKKLIIPGLLNKLMVQAAVRLGPRKLVASFVHFVQKNRTK